MKSGKTVRTFSAKGEHKVTLRTPRWEDLDDLLELINSLVEEKADILKTEKVTREEEIDFLSRALSLLEKGEMFYLVAEVSGKVVAVSEISKRSGYEKHIGAVGIAIRSGFRDLSIGTEILNALLEQAKEMGLRVLTLTTFARNKRALHVFEKVGFVQTGVIPKKFFKDGKYIDEIILTKIME